MMVLPTLKTFIAGGIVKFYEMLDKASNRTPLIAQTLYFEGLDETSNVAVEVAMTYNDDF